MNLETTTSLEAVSDADLREVCRRITLGEQTAYEAVTREIGRSFELIVAEARRLSKIPGPKSAARAASALEGVREGGLAIADRIEAPGALDQSTSDLVAQWALLAGFLEGGKLHDVAQRLFEACGYHADLSARTCSAAAEAVTNTFPSTQAGIAFWSQHSLGRARHYAVDYLLRHDPDGPASRQALTSLYVGVLEQYISADPELMLADAVEVIDARGNPAAAQTFVEGVLTGVSPSYRESLLQRLRRRSFSRPWAEWLEAAPLQKPPGPSEQLLELLRERRIDASAFQSDVRHPPEIQDAIAHYLQHEEQLLTVSRSNEVSMRTIEYPASFLADFKEALGEFSKSMHRIRAVNGEAFGGHLNDARAPIAELNSRSALRAKLLLNVAFFFFTEQRRKDSWGVIPLGRQRAFGMVIPRALFGAAFGHTDFNQMDDDYSGEPDPDDRVGSALATLAYETGLNVTGAWWKPEHKLTFLRTVVDCLDNEEGKILVRRGFVMGDLLVQMLRQKPEGPDLIPRLDRLIREEGEPNPTRVEDEGDLSLFPNIRNASKSYELPPELEKTCALFDLGQMDVVKGALSHPKAKDDYYIVILRHDLDVPVGVGFSLPLLPFLLQRKAWMRGEVPRFLYEEIRVKAIETIIRTQDGPSRIEDFLKIGIDLTELEPPGETGVTRLEDYRQPKARSARG